MKSFIHTLIYKDKNQMNLIFRIALFLFGLSFIVNYFHRQQLYHQGVKLILYIQRQYRSIYLDYFFIAVTMINDPAVVLTITILIMLLSKHKFTSYTTLLFIVWNTYLTGVLKAFYADPRPIWSHHEVQNIGLYCPHQFGNPSGHSWFSIVMVFGVYIDHKGRGKYFWKVYLGILMCFLIPFSRIYLGAHSLNQVLQGLTMGVILSIINLAGGKLMIKRFLINFLNKPKYLYICIAANALYILAYFYNDYFYDIPKSWRQNIMNKCGKVVDKEYLNYMMLIINAAMANVAMGIGLGFRENVIYQQGRNYLAGNWKFCGKNTQQKFLNYFKYFILQLLCILTGVLIIVIGYHLSGKSKPILFGLVIIGTIILGYVYASKAAKLHFYFKVIQIAQKDIIKASNIIKKEVKHD